MPIVPRRASASHFRPVRSSLAVHHQNQPYHHYGNDPRMNLRGRIPGRTDGRTNIRIYVSCLRVFTIYTVLQSPHDTRNPEKRLLLLTSGKYKYPVLT